jgi:hypothetical protein
MKGPAALPTSLSDLTDDAETAFFGNFFTPKLLKGPLLDAEHTQQNLWFSDGDPELGISITSSDVRSDRPRSSTSPAADPDLWGNASNGGGEEVRYEPKFVLSLLKDYITARVDPLTLPSPSPHPPLTLPSPSLNLASISPLPRLSLANSGSGPARVPAACGVGAYQLRPHLARSFPHTRAYAGVPSLGRLQQRAGRVPASGQLRPAAGPDTPGIPGAAGGGGAVKRAQERSDVAVHAAARAAVRVGGSCAAGML